MGSNPPLYGPGDPQTVPERIRVAVLQGKLAFAKGPKGLVGVRRGPLFNSDRSGYQGVVVRKREW